MSAFDDTLGVSQSDGGAPEACARDADALASRAGFDIDGLMRQWACDRDFVLSLIARFQHSARQSLSEIDEGIRSNDRAALARAAHRLVGSASFVRNESVRAVAAQLEASTGSADIETMTADLRRLERELAPCFQWSPDGVVSAPDADVIPRGILNPPRFPRD